MAPLAGPSTLPTINLTNQTMMKLKPAKIFKQVVEPPPAQSPGNFGRSPSQSLPRHITGICFDDRGDHLITAAEDETFQLFNCKTGKHSKTLNSKKYGVDLPRFTHKNTAILHASTKEDDTIRYHSLHDNKYLQYFKGHKGRVISLEMSPVDDGFMSSSMDKTVRLWDLRAPTARGLLALPAAPIIAYDSSGVVFAVAVNTYSRILLYDHFNYDKAPFLVITLEDPTLAQISYPPRIPYMTSLSFSSNGKWLLVGCSGNAHYVLDAFEGHLVAKLEGHVGLERRSMNASITIEPAKGISGEEVCWTPDSKYIIGGSLDGKLVVWDVQNLQTRTGEVDLSIPPRVIMPLVSLDGHVGPSRCVRFNPRYALACSASTDMAFWLLDTTPDSDDVAKELLGKRPFPG